MELKNAILIKFFYMNIMKILYRIFLWMILVKVKFKINLIPKKIKVYFLFKNINNSIGMKKLLELMKIEMIFKI